MHPPRASRWRRPWNGSRIAGAQRRRAGPSRWPHAFRSLDDGLRDQYFEPFDDGRWRLQPWFRTTAQFAQRNLVAPEWPDSVPAQDVVFCRNVLIYFDDAALRRAVENLYEVVRPGGTSSWDTPSR